ncbi:uncharacterized protein TNCV_1596771 [Trichonephila clavipes]|nr:uncharacterized protein TNCV_1596771 [Trichonephila clavipes]
MREEEEGGLQRKMEEAACSSRWPHDKACFAWPPRSPDLTQCDLYLWRFIKDCAYLPPLSSDYPDLRHRIEAAVARITSDTQNKAWPTLFGPSDEWGSH